MGLPRDDIFKSFLFDLLEELVELLREGPRHDSIVRTRSGEFNSLSYRISGMIMVVMFHKRS
jgi:hypothetical protein